ncbi:MAG TPA: metallophosphoesterase, partial [Gemmatimonadaceae bacterium]|nr:metallophosphoesterase [Gemmatimonadaceae bacterium]
MLFVLARGLPTAAVIAIAAAAVYSTVPLVLFIRRLGWPFYPRAWFRLLVVRVVLWVQLLLPLVAGAGLLGMVLGLPFGAPLVAGRWAAAAVLTVGVVGLFVGWVGSRRLVTKEMTVDIPGLPAGLDGLRIVQISDLHIGPHTSRRFLGKVRRAVEGARPDVIAVTGDLVDDRVEDTAAYARALGGLSAPLGVYAIPGNHDVYAGWDGVEEGVRRLTGMRWLVNEAVPIEKGGARVWLVGLGDPAAGGRWGGRFAAARAAPDVARAMARVPDEEPVVALAHNPALWPSLRKRGVALTLSGHTHWGQLAVPSRGWSLASPFQAYAMGVYRENGSTLYVHPGTGYWGVPFRVGAWG